MLYDNAMDLLLALVHQLNGAVFTLIIFVILVIVLTYKAGGITTSFDGFKKNNETIDNKIDGIKTTLAEIKATTNLLYEAHLRTVRTASPPKLTPLGEEVASLIAVKAKVDAHWSEIAAKVEAKKPSNPYDIQTVAMEIAKGCFETIFTPEERNQVKTVAFEKGLNLLEIYPIVGVTIRDKVLEERRMSLEDVERHDPSQSDKAA
jgi:uncharacterized protein YoxC